MKGGDKVKTFLIESHNFQVVITNDWHWGKIPEWTAKSLRKGIASTEHNIYVGTAGDDLSRSAHIAVTVLNPDEDPQPYITECSSKGVFPFISGYKTISMRPFVNSPDGVSLSLSKPNSSFRLWVENTEYPTRIIIQLVESFTCG